MTQVSLPVVEAQPRSRMGKRRAIALVVVHVFILGHIAHYLLSGSTLSPLEPSEAGFSIRDGAINAGAIFLIVLILSTLIMGRFFCGWACHLVAYQDACRWILMRLGLRPKPVRSRLLLFVPLFAAYWLYGRPFVEPLVARWMHGGEGPSLSMHLTTDDFWATFPGPAITILTFLICGFLIVYVMGSKGFCTYGCPYGGLFAIADRFAKGRIRVTDACDGSAQCTANCSSNVDVASEVREYGMVVDPGCLKCMDCISVCPNDALYFGFTPRTTAKADNARRNRKRRGRKQAAPKRSRFRPLAFFYAPETLLAAGLGALMLIFYWSWLAGLAVAGAVAGAAAAVELTRRGATAQATHRQDFTLAEEVFLAASFAIYFAVIFNLYRTIPLLMAVGAAAVVVYLGLVALRLVTAPQVSVQRLRLKASGRLRPAGTAFAALALAGAGLLLHGGVLQWRTALGERAYAAARDARDTGDDETFSSAAASAERHLRFASAWGFAHTRGLSRRMGELTRWQDQPEEALRWYQRELDAGTRNPTVAIGKGHALLDLGRRDEAIEAYAHALDGRLVPPRLFLQLAELLESQGAHLARHEILRRGHERHPTHGGVAFQLCRLLVTSPEAELRDEAEALRVAEAASEANGRSDPNTMEMLAGLYLRAGRPGDALAAIEDALAAARRLGREALASNIESSLSYYRSQADPPAGH